MSKNKRYCGVRGCPHEPPTKRDEYCVSCQCGAFSVSYGQCVSYKNHGMKHVNKKGEEW